MKRQNESAGEKQSPGFLAVMFSAIAAAFGVQSGKNKQRDFESRSAVPYIAAGIMFTLLFIAVLVLIVKWVLSSAT